MNGVEAKATIISCFVDRGGILTRKGSPIRVLQFHLNGYNLGFYQQTLLKS